MKKLAIVVLAAGKGTRMKSEDIPKVLFPLAGKPLLGHVLENTDLLKPGKIVIVVGHLKDKVIEFGNSLNKSNLTYTEQKPQLGTAHAVQQAYTELKDFDGDVLILAGDVPFLTINTLEKFIRKHNENNSGLSVLSTTAPDPSGYGRIVRDEEGNFTNITEHKDASEKIKRIDEINSGVFLVDCKTLFDALSEVSNENAQKEYYLTDIVYISRDRGIPVHAFNLADFEELQGVNSPDDLERAEKLYLKTNKG